MLADVDEAEVGNLAAPCAGRYKRAAPHRRFRGFFKGLE